MANVCGFSFAPNGAIIATQIPGDCQQNQCNGTGQIVTPRNSGQREMCHCVVQNGSYSLLEADLTLAEV